MLTAPKPRSWPVAALLLPLLAAMAHSQMPPPPRLAAETTIYRDRWGIPHVRARNDAGAAFGFAYAQAEDYFARIERNYIEALGRAAEVDGPDAVAQDRLNRALGIPRLAREEYAGSIAERASSATGSSRGSTTTSRTTPRSGRCCSPIRAVVSARLHPLQLLPATASLGERRASRGTPPRAGRNGARRKVGSNGWVVGPSRSASGHSLLFINPHLPYFGPGQVYEGHVQSEEGWDFTGYTRFGFPFPYVGHNATLGWVSTDNAADQPTSTRDVRRSRAPARLSLRKRVPLAEEGTDRSRSGPTAASRCGR